MPSRHFEHGVYFVVLFETQLLRRVILFDALSLRDAKWGHSAGFFQAGIERWQQARTCMLEATANEALPGKVQSFGGLWAGGVPRLRDLV